MKDPITICGNRVTFLFNDQLQALFRAVILEQGEWVSDDDSSHGMIERVPMRRTTFQEKQFTRLLDLDAKVSDEVKVLGTATGSLLSELKYSPRSFLEPLIFMLKHVQELNKASVHSDTATFILYLIELSVTIESYLVSIIGKHEKLGVDGGVLVLLTGCKLELQGQLRGPIDEMLRRWLETATNEVIPIIHIL